MGNPGVLDARDCSFLEDLLGTIITAYDDGDDGDDSMYYISKLSPLRDDPDETLVPKFDFRCMPVEQSFITLEQLIDIDEDIQEDIDELLADEIMGKKLFYVIVPHRKTPIRRVMRI